MPDTHRVPDLTDPVSTDLVGVVGDPVDPVAALRFLHTSDWQLGMTRHFLDADAQARFSQARLDVIRRLADLARTHDCAFVVVAGDVFETNHPTTRTIGRALEALAAFDVPVYLLPGNHDPLDPSSVFRSRTFREHCPPGVEVLDDSRPRMPVPGVEVVGVPWRSKHPVGDPVPDVVDQLGPLPPGHRRVLVAHGAVAEISGDFDQRGAIDLDTLCTPMHDGRLHYVALGDRHGTLAAGASGRVWYSGAPEPTSAREQDPGNALVVDLAADPPAVQPVRVGDWQFVELVAVITDDHDVDQLLTQIDALEHKTCTVVQVKVSGSLTIQQAARLDAGLEARREVFAALEAPRRHEDVTIRPELDELDALPVTGYVAAAVDRLRQRAVVGGAGPDTGGAASSDAGLRGSTKHDALPATDAPLAADALLATDALSLLLQFVGEQEGRR